MPSQNTPEEKIAMHVLYARLQALESAPITARIAARRLTADYLADSAEVGNNLSMLLSGAYGLAEMLRAVEIIEGKARSNRPADLMLLMCGLDCQCPADEVVRAWKGLTAIQRARLDAVCHQAIADYRVAE